MTEQDGGGGHHYAVQSDHPDIQKCQMEPGRPDEDGNTTWAVEVPDDASVRVELVVKAAEFEENVGGTGNMSGRFELTHITDGGEDG